MKFYLFILGLIVMFFNSCIQHQAFVASSFEPVVVEKKNDMQASVSFRPMKYLDINGTYALTNHLAVRTDLGGFIGIYNISGSLIFFNTYKKLRYYIAPTYNYQNNQITRDIPTILGNNGKYYKYFCIYNGVGTSIGFAKKMKNYDFQFNIKGQYNIVKTYYYENYKDNGSSKNTGFEVLENEVCDKKIPNFLSVEPSISFISTDSKKGKMKVQIGISICEITYSHSYSYTIYQHSSLNVTRQNFHPTFLPMYVSIGYIFSNKKETLPIAN